MPTDTAKPKTTTKGTKAKATPADAVAAFADAYRTWWRSIAIKSTGSDTEGPKIAARVELCTLAGCENPGPGHKTAECAITAELQVTMRAAQRACLPGVYADRTAEAADALTERLTELSA